MKIVEVVRPEEVEVKPFYPAQFSALPMDERSEHLTAITKKEIKAIAGRIGLSCNHAEVDFAKKVINAYIKEKRQ